MRPTLQRKPQPKILRKSRILISSKSLTERLGTDTLGVEGVHVVLDDSLVNVGLAMGLVETLTNQLGPVIHGLLGVVPLGVCLHIT